MEAAPVNIVEYFNGSKQGLIPLFQRPYSWVLKDWTTLWNDLMVQYEPDDRSSHFMGAVVTVPVKSVPIGVTKYLVIDGQQRLTTLSLLLAAIRDKAISDGDEKTSGIISDYLVNRHYDTPDDLKLVPTQSDRSAYNAVIYGKGAGKHEETRVIQAYRFFEKKLEGEDSENNPISASQILQIIQQSLQAVMINLGEADDPYLIFESLNHKGKPLNQADLVRNYVLMRFQHSTSTGGEQEAAYEQLWRPMEDGLSSLMPEFLRHYGMRYGNNLRKGDIYVVAKQEFEKLSTTDEVRNSLVDMKDASIAYQKFLRPEEEDDQQVGRRFKGILELDSTVFYPLLIRLYLAWDRDQIGYTSLLKCLDLLESFYVRRLVCGVPTNALNKITLELCSSLPSAGVETWLQERLTQGIGNRRCPSDREFVQDLVQQRIYPRRKLARYMLIALEEAFEHKEPVETTSATMEHVMPQTLSDEWIQELGDRYSEIHDQWLDTLGNLTLTGYNSELGNSSFGEKKAKLQNTHFELSRSLLAEPRWGPSEIEARGRMLSQIALKRWQMD